MERVHVVTSFLLRRDGGRERILLLKRSEKVGSFQGWWAGGSGYIEGLADAQAMTEIREETRLREADVELLNRGGTIEAPDPSGGRTYVVHPYLFLVHDADAVRLNWEHVDWRWVVPNAVCRYWTVPKLRQDLGRLYPAPPPHVENSLRADREDATSGASELARQAAEALADAARSTPAQTPAALTAELLRVSQWLAWTQSSMAPEGNIVASVVAELPGQDSGLEQIRPPPFRERRDGGSSLATPRGASPGMRPAS